MEGKWERDGSGVKWVFRSCWWMGWRRACAEEAGGEEVVWVWTWVSGLGSNCTQAPTAQPPGPSTRASKHRASQPKSDMFHMFIALVGQMDM